MPIPSTLTRRPNGDPQRSAAHATPSVQDSPLAMIASIATRDLRRWRTAVQAPYGLLSSTARLCIYRLLLWLFSPAESPFKRAAARASRGE